MPVILRALGDANPRVALHAANVLQVISPSVEGIAEKVTAAAKNDDSYVKRATTYLLIELA